MTSPARLAAVTVVAGLVAMPTSPASGAPFERTSRQIRPGVRLTRLHRRDPPLRVYVLRVSLAKPVRMEVALAARRFPFYATTTLEVARREDAVAAINGDFGPGRPLHALAIDGELVTSGLVRGPVFAPMADEGRAFIGGDDVTVIAIPNDGDPIPLASWNAGQPSSGEVVVFTGRGGSIESSEPPVCTARLLPTSQPSWASRAGVRRTYVVDDRTCGTPLASGRGIVLSSRRRGSGSRSIRSLRLGASVDVAWTPGWPGVADVEGGMPRLVRSGSVDVPRGCRSLFCARQPRTGVGITRGCVDRDVTTRCTTLLVVVDGRRWAWSVGMTLKGFAKLMHRLGSFDALNFDGGGSSTMVVNGKVINRPVQRPLRPVPAALIVTADPDAGESWSSERA